MIISKKEIRNIGIGVAVVVFLGFGLYYYIPIWKPAFNQRNIFLAVAMIATTLITFFGFLRAGTGQNSRVNETVLRTAITVTIVLLYLLLVSIVAFWNKGTNSSDKLPALTDTMINNFTTIVGVVIASFFTASAYVEGKKEDAKKTEETKTDQTTQSDS